MVAGVPGSGAKRHPIRKPLRIRTGDGVRVDNYLVDTAESADVLHKPVSTEPDQCRAMCPLTSLRARLSMSANRIHIPQRCE